MAAGRRWFVVPGMWSRRRTAGEVVLAVVMALLAAGTEELLGGEGGQLVVVAVTAALLSLLRRRFPTTVLIATAALAPLVPGFGVLLILVGWSAGRYVPGAGRALAVFTVAYAVNLGATLVESWDLHRVLSVALLSTLYFLATTLAPGLAHRYWTQRRTLLHALQERNAQLMRERVMVEGQARLRERQRIAQDMHDSLGHQLALISVHTGALEVDRELTDRQRQAVGVLRNASVTAMHELREVVGILRDGVEAPAEPAFTVTAQSRCVAGKATLIASLTNEGEKQAEVVVESQYGTKRLSLAAGKSASTSFSTRTVELAAGQLTAKVTTTVAGEPITTTHTAAYTTRTCG